MITVERLDKIQQDLEWARENADRSAQTRLFIHHVPFLLTILRPVAEALDAQIAEEEEYLASIDEQFDEDETEESTEDATDSESETETGGKVSRAIQNLLGKSDDAVDQSVDESEEAVEGDGSPVVEILTDEAKEALAEETKDDIPF